MSLLKEGVITLGETLTLMHKETYTSMSTMELFVIEEIGNRNMNRGKT